MSKPYFDDGQVQLRLGDCLDVLPTIADNSIDAIVTDGPYGLSELSTVTVLQAIATWLAGDRNHVPDGKGFMGRDWDRFVPPPGVWDQCLRVLKPGGHLLAFAAPRAQDLMGLSIRIAGFEIRDSMNWIMGSGFPKSHDVSKAIDRAAGAERKVIGIKPGHEGFAGRTTTGHRIAGEGHDGWTRPWASRDSAESYHLATAPATEDARRWGGWGTALKPAHEPIIVARKPLVGTVAANVLEHGTGGLNIDACRIPAGQDYRDKCASVVGLDSNRNGDAYGEWTGARTDSAHVAGRWPTNVMFTHSPDCGDRCAEGCPVADLELQSPDAARFFPMFRYEAKAPAHERPRLEDGTAHSTVKPLDLIRWLVRLVTPPGGTVLDPFAGSGTTLEACVVEGFHGIGIEKDPAYAELCRVRLDKPIQPDLFGGAA